MLHARTHARTGTYTCAQTHRRTYRQMPRALFDETRRLNPASYTTHETVNTGLHTRPSSMVEGAAGAERSAAGVWCGVPLLEPDGVPPSLKL